MDQARTMHAKERAEPLLTPFNSLDHAYWRKKLPQGFQFYMDRLARGILRVQPSNVLEFAAVFMEEMLVQRNKELSQLPEVPYLTKMDLQIVPRGSPPKPPRPVKLTAETPAPEEETARSPQLVQFQPALAPTGEPCDMCQKSDFAQTSSLPVNTGVQVDFGRDTSTQCENIFSMLQDSALCQGDHNTPGATCALAMGLGLQESSGVDGGPQAGYYKTTITSNGGVITVCRETTLQVTPTGIQNVQSITQGVAGRTHTPPPSPYANESPGFNNVCDRCRHATSNSTVLRSATNQTCDYCMDEYSVSEYMDMQTQTGNAKYAATQTSDVKQKEGTTQTVGGVKQTSNQTCNCDVKSSDTKSSCLSTCLCDACCEDLIFSVAVPTPPESESVCTCAKDNHQATQTQLPSRQDHQSTQTLSFPRQGTQATQTSQTEQRDAGNTPPPNRGQQNTCAICGDCTTKDKPSAKPQICCVCHGQERLKAPTPVCRGQERPKAPTPACCVCHEQLLKPKAPTPASGRVKRRTPSPALRRTPSPAISAAPPVMQTFIQVPGFQQTGPVSPPRLQTQTLYPASPYPAAGSPTLGMAPQPMALVPASMVPTSMTYFPASASPPIPSPISQAVAAIPTMLAPMLWSPMMAMSPCHMGPVCPCAAQQMCPYARTCHAVCSHAEAKQPPAFTPAAPSPAAQKSDVCSVCKDRSVASQKQGSADKLRVCRVCKGPSESRPASPQASDVCSDAVCSLLNPSTTEVLYAKSAPVIQYPDSPLVSPQPQVRSPSKQMVPSPQPSQPSAANSFISSQGLGLSPSQCSKCGKCPSGQGSVCQCYRPRSAKSAPSQKSSSKSCGDIPQKVLSSRGESCRSLPKPIASTSSLCSNCRKSPLVSSVTITELCSSCRCTPQPAPPKEPSNELCTNCRCTNCRCTPLPQKEPSNELCSSCRGTPLPQKMPSDELCSSCRGTPLPQKEPSDDLCASCRASPVPQWEVSNERCPSCGATPVPPRVPSNERCPSCGGTPAPRNEQINMCSNCETPLFTIESGLCDSCRGGLMPQEDQLREVSDLCESCQLDETTFRMCDTIIQDADDATYKPSGEHQDNDVTAVVDLPDNASQSTYTPVPCPSEPAINVNVNVQVHSSFDSAAFLEEVKQHISDCIEKVGKQAISPPYPPALLAPPSPTSSKPPSPEPRSGTCSVCKKPTPVASPAPYNPPPKIQVNPAEGCSRCKKPTPTASPQPPPVTPPPREQASPICNRCKKPTPTATPEPPPVTPPPKGQASPICNRCKKLTPTATPEPPPITPPPKKQASPICNRCKKPTPTATPEPPPVTPPPKKQASPLCSRCKKPTPTSTPEPSPFESGPQDQAGPVQFCSRCKRMERQRCQSMFANSDSPKEIADKKRAASSPEVSKKDHDACPTCGCAKSPHPQRKAEPITQAEARPPKDICEDLKCSHVKINMSIFPPRKSEEEMTKEGRLMSSSAVMLWNY